MENVQVDICDLTVNARATSQGYFYECIARTPFGPLRWSG